MSAFDLINTLDANSTTSKQLGENMHTEYAWSNDIEEQIVQFNFQLVRTNETQIGALSLIL